MAANLFRKDWINITKKHRTRRNSEQEDNDFQFTDPPKIFLNAKLKSRNSHGGAREIGQIARMIFAFKSANRVTRVLTMARGMDGSRLNAHSKTSNRQISFKYLSSPSKARPTSETIARQIKNRSHSRLQMRSLCLKKERQSDCTKSLFSSNSSDLVSAFLSQKSSSCTTSGPDKYLERNSYHHDLWFHIPKIFSFFLFFNSTKEDGREKRTNLWFSPTSVLFDFALVLKNKAKSEQAAGDTKIFTVFRVFPWKGVIHLRCDEILLSSA